MNTQSIFCFHDHEYNTVKPDKVYEGYPFHEPNRKRARTSSSKKLPESSKTRAIVIDAGSYEYRAGWSHQETPYCM
jgi:hypothetical protein